MMWRRGDSIREMERTLGETLPRIRRYLRESGGIPPVPRQRRASRSHVKDRRSCTGRPHLVDQRAGDRVGFAPVGPWQPNRQLRQPY